MTVTLKNIAIRDDLEFLDGTHIEDEAVLVFDSYAWTYSTISRLDYELLAAIDELDSFEEVIDQINESYGLRVDERKVLQTLELAKERNYLEIWSYDPPVQISAVGVRKLCKAVDLAFHKTTNPKKAELAVQGLMATRNGTQFAKDIRKIRGHSIGAYEFIYDRLLMQAFGRKRVKLGFMQSTIDLFDPTPLFRYLKPTVGWIYSSWGICIFLGAALIGYGHAPSGFIFNPVSVSGSSELAAMPLRVLVWSPVVTWSSVIVHEVLGHALALAVYGGRVKTVGFMLLLGVLPAGFANVTDSYRISSRAKRIMISLAGLYVNFGLAAAACIAAREHTPSSVEYGVLRLLCVTNLSLIIPNLMPWLKFDGYYILADILGKTTLWDDSKRVGKQLSEFILYGDTTILNAPKHDTLLVTLFLVGRTTFLFFIMASWVLFLLPRLSGALGVLGFILFVALILGPRTIKIFPTIRSILRYPGGYLKDLAQLMTTWARSPLRLGFLSLLVLVVTIPQPVSRAEIGRLEPRFKREIVAPATARIERIANKGYHPGGVILAQLSSSSLAAQLQMDELEVQQARTTLALLSKGATKQEREHHWSNLRTRSQRMRGTARSLRRLQQAGDLVSTQQLQEKEDRLLQQATHFVKGEQDRVAAQLDAQPELLLSQRSQLAAAIARRDQTRDLISSLAIRSTMNGIVSWKREFGEGDLVKKGEVLGEVYDPDNLVVVVETKDRAITVSENKEYLMSVKLRNRKIPELTLKIESVVENAKTSSKRIRTSRLRIPRSVRLFPGESVWVEIHLGQMPLYSRIARNVAGTFSNVTQDVSW